MVRSLFVCSILLFCSTITLAAGGNADPANAGHKPYRLTLGLDQPPISALTRAVTTAVVAQEAIEGGPGKGASSLNLSGMFNDIGETTATGSFSVDYSYFVTDNLELGPSLSGTLSSSPVFDSQGRQYGNQADINGFFGVSGRFNLLSPKAGRGLIPYLRAGYSQSFSSQTGVDSFSTAEAAAGTRIFIRPQQAVYAEVVSRQTKTPSFDVSGSTISKKTEARNTININFGLTFFFTGK